MGRADEPELHSLLKEEGGDSAGSPRRDTKHDASSSPSQGPSPPYRAKCWEEGHLLMQNQMKHCEGEIPPPSHFIGNLQGPAGELSSIRGDPGHGRQLLWGKRRSFFQVAGGLSSRKQKGTSLVVQWLRIHLPVQWTRA